MEQSVRHIQFHVGLGKVASKYLQYEVFPALQGIQYIPTRLFYKSGELIRQSQASNILVSREFDQQFDTEVRRFASRFPDTGAIMLLRRHDSWIASQYRRFAKNGFTGSFSDFINPVDNNGKFRIEDLNYRQKIQTLEEVFSRPPLVILYDDLLQDPQKVILKIAGYCHAQIDVNQLKYGKIHSSYSEKQIKFMQQAARRIPVNRDKWKHNRLLFFLQRLPVLAIRYSILYLGLIIPARWVGNQPLIPPADLERIRSLTEEDWNACVAYANRHSGN